MPQPIGPLMIVPANGGLNKRDDRENLNIAAGETDDMLNVYPRDGAVWKKPGLTKAIATQVTGGYYDMVRHPMNTTFASPTPVEDRLYGIYQTDVGNPRIAAFDPIGATLTDIGQIEAFNDGDFSKELIPASTDMIHITIGNGSGDSYKLEHTGVVFALSLNNAQLFFRSGDWHRDRLVLVDHVARGLFAYFMGWSNEGDPRTFDAANQIELRRLGYSSSINGAKASGDAFYFFSLGSMFIMTGADDDLWEIERLPYNIGALGKRSFTAARDGVMYGIVNSPGWLTSGLLDQDRAYPSNIAAIRGDTIVIIGDKIALDIEAIQSQQVGGGPLQRKSRRSVEWEDRESIIFVPQVHYFGALAETTAFVMHRQRQQEPTFWKWTWASALGPNAFAYNNRKVFVGCGDGFIRFLDESAANDDGTAFTSQWTTGRAFGPNRGKKYSPSRVIISGAQDSGSNKARLWIAREEDAFASIADVDLSKGYVNIDPTSKGLVRAGRYFRYRLVHGANAVGARHRWMGYHLKDMGTAA